MRSLYFCPGCNAERLPPPGVRCPTVFGLRCRIRRCDRCAGLGRGLRCGHCGAVLPLDLVGAHVELAGEEADERFGRRAWPAQRAVVLIDEPSGAAWVSAGAWARLRDSVWATNEVMRAGLVVAPRGVEIVGSFVRERGEVTAEAMRAARWIGRDEQPGELHGRDEGRLVRLTLRPSRNLPYGDVKRAPARVDVEVGLLIEALDATSRLRRYHSGDGANEYVRDGRPLPSDERLDACAERLREALRPLLRCDRARQDLGDLAVLRLAALIEPDVSTAIETSWSPGEVWGRGYCEGAACPGLDREAGRGTPHPASCLGPGQSAEDRLLRESFGRTEYRPRLECASRGPVEVLDAAEVARRDEEARARC